MGAASKLAARSRSRDRFHSGYHGHQQENDSLNGESEEEEEDEDEDLEEDDHWATSTDNNWTDYDQDIYMHRNTTKYGGGGNLMGRGMFSRDDVNL